MELQHGTDNIETIEAFKNKTLLPSAWDSYEEFDFDDNPSWQKLECEEKHIDPEQVIYLAVDASNYAIAALITIEVDENDIIQISDDEYVMSVDADYKIINIETNVNGNLTRMYGTR